jgi:hypothetical protein
MQTSRHCPPPFSKFDNRHGHFIQTHIAIPIFIQSVEDFFYLALVFGAENALDVFLIKRVIAFRYKRCEDSMSESFGGRSAFKCP